MRTRRVRLALAGLGNVGRNVAHLLTMKRDVLQTRYGLDLVVVGAADSSGAALHADGLDCEALVRLKEAKQGVATYAGAGQPGMSALDLVREAQADMLVEMSPTNLQHGQPGLQCIREALGRGWDVVTANKGPLVLAYAELMTLAESKGRRVLFSACVGGGLPSVNVGRRDLIACEISKFEGILNSTTHYILTAMHEQAKAFEDALADAQRIGIAEADPSLDIDGWDAANKCVILANSVLGIPATLQDVAVTGIRQVTIEDLRTARRQGASLKLLVTAERIAESGGYRLSVQPTALPLSHPLGQLSGEDMGIVYHTDTFGRIAVSIAERGPVPTAAAVLRDVVTIGSP